MLVTGKVKIIVQTNRVETETAALRNEELHCVNTGLVIFMTTGKLNVL